MTREEAITRALDTLHTIGGAMQTRRLIEGRNLNDTIRQKLAAKALSDKQIEDMALTAWVEIVENTRPILKNVTIHVCSSESMEPFIAVASAPTGEQGGGR